MPIAQADRETRDQALEIAWQELTAPGERFEITRCDVRGQSLQCYAHASPTLREVWLETRQFGSRDYLVFQGERITYAQAHEACASIAAWLQAQGIGRGDRVAIAMRNYPEWMLIYWACALAGVTVVGMNAWWVSEEMAYALKDSAPRAIFCDRERLVRLRDIKDRDHDLRIIAVRADAGDGETSWRDVLACAGDLPTVAIDPDDDACIFYTSGTTGFPKGAQLTHRGCVSNLMSLQFITEAQGLAIQRTSTETIDLGIGTGAVPVALVTTPLFHVTANNCLAHTITAAGGTLIFMYKWDALEALKLVQDEKVTTMSGVPTMARELINHPQRKAFDLSSLTAMSGGGAAVPPDLVEGIDAQLETTVPSAGYGMTETCGVICVSSADFLVSRPTSVGRPLPHFELRVVDDEGGDVAPGDVGEVIVRGAAVIKGYLNRPEATAESIVDGWLHTGDLGRQDENGFVYIVDRKKDMVLRGGENIYCSEVEAALFHHSNVAEACIFAVADERLGEEVGAAIVPHAGVSVTAHELRAFVQSRIAKHKIPRYIWVLDAPLPRNASGKFLRRELQAILQTGNAE